MAYWTGVDAVHLMGGIEACGIVMGVRTTSSMVKGGVGFFVVRKADDCHDQPFFFFSFLLLFFVLALAVSLPISFPVSGWGGKGRQGTKGKKKKEKK